jgi:hypothetical protein
MAILRAFGAVVAGLVVALVLVVGVELFSAVVHPLPESFDGSQEQMCAHVARYPAWVLAVIVPIWGAAALVSTWIAGRLGNLASTLVVGLLLVAAVAFNLSMLPYPIWFKVACLVVIPAAAVAGGYRRRGRLQRAG